MFNKKVLKEADGVTLITLVVTIVLMFILVGITAIASFGDRTVMEESRKASDKTIENEIKEKINLQVQSSYDQAGIINMDLLNKNLQKNVSGIKIRQGDDGKYAPISATNQIKSLPITAIYNDVEFEITGVCYLSDVASEARNYGKYINYPLDINGDGNENYDWKIFYGDSEGNVYIKACDYVMINAEKTDETEEKEYACAGMKTALESIGMSTQKYTARWNLSPNSNYTSYTGDYSDIRNNLTLFKHNEYKNEGGCILNEHPNSENEAAALMFLDPKIWDFLVIDKYANYAIGGPTIELFVDSWNKHTNRKKYPELTCLGYNDNGYYIGLGEGSSTETTADVSSASGARDLLYFPHTEKFENCEGYWLVSPSAKSGNDIMTVECNGKISSRQYNSSDKLLGFCPVVCLRKGNRVQYVTKTEKDPETGEETSTSYFEFK